MPELRKPASTVRSHFAGTAAMAGGATRFTSLNGGTVTATESLAQLKARRGGNLVSLTARVMVASAAGACTVTVRKGGADTAATVTLQGDGTSNEVTWTGTVAIAADDLLCMELTGAAGSGPTVTWLLEWAQG